LKKAFEDVEKTNKRVMLLRKKVDVDEFRIKRGWKIWRR
jgi:hypothetical protein